MHFYEGLHGFERFFLWVLLTLFDRFWCHFWDFWGLWGDSQTVLYLCHPALIHRRSSTTTSDRKQWQRCEIINGVVAQPNTFPAQHMLRRMADARKRANRRPRRMVPHLRRNWQLLRLRTITLNVNASLLLLQGTHSLRTPRRKGKDRGRQPHAPHGFTLWRAGRFGEQWERVKQDHGKRSAGQQKRDDHQLQREARRVAKLVDQCLLSRGLPTVLPRNSHL